MQIEGQQYSEIDVLTFCCYTPLVLCVSPMRWDFLFLARSGRVRVNVIVAQDLAVATCEKSIVMAAMAVRREQQEYR